MLVAKGGLLAVKGKGGDLDGGVAVAGDAPHPASVRVSPTAIPMHFPPMPLRAIMIRLPCLYNETPSKKVTVQGFSVDTTFFGTLL